MVMSLGNRLLWYAACFGGMIGAFLLPPQTCGDNPLGLFLTCVALALVMPFMRRPRKEVLAALDKGYEPKEFKPVEIKGKPLSEMIIEDRR
jgi:predicted branched-subunit amino acid permease